MAPSVVMSVCVGTVASYDVSSWMPWCPSIRHDGCPKHGHSMCNLLLNSSICLTWQRSRVFFPLKDFGCRGQEARKWSWAMWLRPVLIWAHDTIQPHEPSSNKIQWSKPNFWSCQLSTWYYNFLSQRWSFIRIRRYIYIKIWSTNNYYISWW